MYQGTYITPIYSRKHKHAPEVWHTSNHHMIFAGVPLYREFIRFQTLWFDFYAGEFDHLLLCWFPFCLSLVCLRHLWSMGFHCYCDLRVAGHHFNIHTIVPGIEIPIIKRQSYRYYGSFHTGKKASLCEIVIRSLKQILSSFRLKRLSIHHGMNVAYFYKQYVYSHPNFRVVTSQRSIRW